MEKNSIVSKQIQLIPTGYFALKTKGLLKAGATTSMGL